MKTWWISPSIELASSLARVMLIAVLIAVLPRRVIRAVRSSSSSKRAGAMKRARGLDDDHVGAGFDHRVVAPTASRQSSVMSRSK